MLVALGHFIKDLYVKYLFLRILLGSEQNSIQTKLCFFLILTGGDGAKFMLNEVSLITTVRFSELTHLLEKQISTILLFTELNLTS